MAFKASPNGQPQLQKFVEDYHYAKNSPNHTALSSQDDEFSSSNNDDDTNKDSLNTIPSSEIKRMFSRRQNHLQSRLSSNIDTSNEEQQLDQEPIHTVDMDQSKVERGHSRSSPPTTAVPKEAVPVGRRQDHKVEFVESSTPMRNPYLNASVSAQRPEARHQQRESIDYTAKFRPRLSVRGRGRSERASFDEGDHDQSAMEENNANIYKELKQKDQRIHELEKMLNQYKIHLEELQREVHEYQEEPTRGKVPRSEPQADNFMGRVKLCGAGERMLDETDFGLNYYTLYMENMQNVSWVGATNSLKNILNKFGITYDELRGYMKFLSEDEVQFIQDLHQELHGRPLKLNRQNKELMHNCFRVMLEEVHRLRIRAERNERRQKQ